MTTPKRRRTGNEDADEARGEGRRGGEDTPPAAAPRKMGPKAAMRYREKIIEERFGYSSVNNPFGDSNLAAPFVWKKKHTILKAAGQDFKPTPQTFLQQTQQKLLEIDLVKKRRDEREMEEKMLEDQKALLAREKEAENFEEWAKKEEEFHREMAKQRIAIRLEQGRERTIDLVAKALAFLDGEEFDDLTLLKEAPHESFRGMTSAELDEVIEDIKLHLPSGGDASGLGHLRFWKSLLTLAEETHASVVEAEAENAAAAGGADIRAATTSTAAVSPSVEAGGGGLVRDTATGIPAAVAAEISTLMTGKGLTDLEVLELQIEKKLKSSGDDTEEEDLTFWEAIQERLPYYKARALCADVHEKARQRAQQIKARRAGSASRRPVSAASDRSGVEDGGEDRSMNSSAEPPHVDGDHDGEQLDGAGSESSSQYSPVLEPYGDPADNEDESRQPPPPSLERRPHSPVLQPMRNFLNKLSEVLDPLEDRDRRENLKVLLLEKERQRRVAAAGLDPSKVATTESSSSGSGMGRFDSNSAGFDVFERFVRDERRAGNRDELPLREEQAIQRSHYDWEDKYRPRKPRFFNRVKTGYEWNKYNQTHYDHDNPPPKAVQGYKFNIFYPDLIDKSKTPTWSLEKPKPEEGGDEDDGSTCIIRFHAGPPYEDVAFKIINRQWELNPRRGFRNCFDRGILQLFFNFTRYRYRR